MAPRVQADVQTDHLRLIPGTLRVEGRTESRRLFFGILHASAAHMCIAH